MVQVINAKHLHPVLRFAFNGFRELGQLRYGHTYGALDRASSRHYYRCQFGSSITACNVRSEDHGENTCGIPQFLPRIVTPCTYHFHTKLLLAAAAEAADSFHRRCSAAGGHY